MSSKDFEIDSLLDFPTRHVSVTTPSERRLQCLTLGPFFLLTLPTIWGSGLLTISQLGTSSLVSSLTSPSPVPDHIANDRGI